MIDQNVQQMVTGEFGNVDLIKEDVDNKNKTINLTVSGKKISDKKIHAAKQNLGQYNMKGYLLNIIQVAQVQNMENQLNRQVNMILNQCQKSKKQRAIADKKSRRSVTIIFRKWHLKLTQLPLSAITTIRRLP